MKKLILTLMFAVATLFSFAQSVKYNELKQLYRNNGYSIGNEQIVYCVEGQTGYTIMNFTPSTEYVIVAMSDDAYVTDVDLYLYYYDTGTLFDKDDDELNVAILSFGCSSNTKTKIVIKNVKSYTPKYASPLRYFIAYR